MGQWKEQPPAPTVRPRQCRPKGRPGNTMRVHHVIFLGYLVIAASSTDLVEEDEREAKQEERLEKSLLNSFPFNAGEKSEHHGDHHGHEEDETPNLRQLVALSRSAPQARYGVEEEEEEDGKKCVQKVMMVEELIWDDVVTCDHSYDSGGGVRGKLPEDLLHHDGGHGNERDPERVQKADGEGL